MKRSHDRGIADDEVRKLENTDNFWKQNTLSKRLNVGYMNALEWCGGLGWNPSPVEHNGNFSFRCNKINFSLAPHFKSMWRHTGISSLETNLVWFRQSHSFPVLHSAPRLPELQALVPSLLKYLTEGNSPSKSETVLIPQKPNLYKLHWITIDTPLPLVTSPFQWCWALIQTWESLNENFGRSRNEPMLKSSCPYLSLAGNTRVFRGLWEGKK